MSLPNQSIRCTGCAFEGIVQRRPVTLEYHLPDGGKVESHRVLGWCPNCKGVRDVEALLQTEELRRQVSEYARRRKSVGAFLVRTVDRALGGKDAEGQKMAHLKELLRVAESRRSPPRCLTCGSSFAVKLSFDDSGVCQNVPHTCGGRLTLRPADPGAPRFAYRPEVVQLDPEGNRLDKSEPQESASRSEFRSEFEQTVLQLKSAPEQAQAAVGHAINLAHSLFMKSFGSSAGYVASSQQTQAEYVRSLTQVEVRFRDERNDAASSLGFGLFKMWIGTLQAGDTELSEHFAKELAYFSKKGDFSFP